MIAPILTGIVLLFLGIFIGHLNNRFGPVNIFEFCLPLDNEYNLAGYD